MQTAFEATSSTTESKMSSRLKYLLQDALTPKECSILCHEYGMFGYAKLSREQLKSKFAIDELALQLVKQVTHAKLQNAQISEQSLLVSS
jgi:hypothetical protein